MLLTGTFARTLDEKQRIAIPKRWRDLLGEPLESLYITPGNDGSLNLFTEAELTRLAERLSASSPGQQEVRAFGRLFYARAERAELDNQGRVRIPPELAHAAGLQKEVILLGVQNHMELWDKVAWETYLAAQQQRYDELTEAAFGGKSST